MDRPAAGGCDSCVGKGADMRITLDTMRSPTLETHAQCCGNCKFWWCYEVDDINEYMTPGDDDYTISGASGFNGECRRYPPTLLPKRVDFADGRDVLGASHPDCGAFHWCGEYQSRQPITPDAE